MFSFNQDMLAISVLLLVLGVVWFIVELVCFDSRENVRRAILASVVMGIGWLGMLYQAVLLILNHWSN